MKQQRDTNFPDQFVVAVEQHPWRRSLILACAGVLGLLVLAVGLSAALGNWWPGLSPVAVAGLSAALLAVPAVGLCWLVLQLARRVSEHRARQMMAAVDDDLTGLANRRHFLTQVEREFARCRRYNEEGALLLIDTDHLRRINEHLGQACGDALLCELTRRVGATLRQPDLLARFGGAQLAVYLPKTDPLGALDAAERIRQQVAGSPYRWQQSHVVATVSIGVATVHMGQLSVDSLVHEGEQALEAAKSAGRNCVRAAPMQPRHGESRPVTPS